MSSTHTDLQEKTTKLQYFSEQLGLQINVSKTKIMDFTNVNNVIQINNNILEKVEHFTYLGSRITANADSSTEIMSRIALSSSAFNSLSNIWR